MNLREKMDYAFDKFNSIGIGREATMGAFGSMMGESGRQLDTKAYNPDDPFSGSRGIAQHNGPRLDAMESFNSKWGDPKDFRHQVDFIAHELSTTEKKTRDKLRNPDITRTKAADVWTKDFERPKNPEAKMAERRKNADFISKELSKSVEAIANQTPTDSLSAKAAAAATQSAPRGTQTAQSKQAAPGFDVGRFAEPTAQVDATPAGRFAGPQTANFDMGRFGPSPADKAPVGPSQVAQAAPGFDMGRFGPAEATRTVSPEARTALGYSPEAIGAKTAAAAALNAAAPMSSLASVNQPAAKSTYRDPMVSVAPATPSAKAAPAVQAETARNVRTQAVATAPASTSMSANRGSAAAQSQANPGGFSSAIDGISAAVNGVSRDLSNAGKSLMSGDISGAFASLSGGPANPASATNAAQAAQVAAANAEAAGAKSQGFLDQETNLTAAIGTIAGGVFGGAPGAIAGGLLGQGIGKALSGITSGLTSKTTAEVVDGVSSGFKNAMSDLFGTARDPYSADRAAGMPAGGWNSGSFPNAPSTPNGQNRGNEDRSGWDDRGSQQTRDAIDSGSSGLW